LKKSSTSRAEERAADSITESIDDALERIADEEGLDAGGLKRIASEISKSIKAELKKEGLVRDDLPEDLQDKLKVIEEINEERKTEKVQKKDTEVFAEKWNNFTTVLKQSYPNAGSHELAEAEKLMYDISHSPEGGVIVDQKNKILRPYPFDYILYQNRDKFNTLLKVMPKGRSGETSNREMVEIDSDEDIDLDPENMTPEKMKKYQDQKVRNKGKDTSVYMVQ
jgi:hypothetical protein